MGLMSGMGFLRHETCSFVFFFCFFSEQPIRDGIRDDIAAVKNVVLEKSHAAVVCVLFVVVRDFFFFTHNEKCFTRRVCV